MKKLLLFIGIIAAFQSFAQVKDAPARKEGEGPYTQLILRNAIVVDGTGAPPYGPTDIVIEKNRIVSVSAVGYPGVPVKDSRRPKLKEGGKEIDCKGMYVMPGFIDMHGHIGGAAQGTPSEYVFKLWMAHGITTIREPGSMNGIKWTLDHKKKSLDNSITAPRIFAYTSFGQGSDKPIATPEDAIAWVKKNAEAGADGIKFFGAAPAIMDAAIKENKRLGLRSMTHHAQLAVARWNVVHSARAGLTSMEHWYGLPESMLENTTIQDYKLDYNYQNEQDRFSEAGKLWEQAAQPGSKKWIEVRDELLKLDFTLDPTLNIYDANRDLHRARRLEWHDEYTLPSLMNFYQPNRESHGSYWFSWGTEQEVAWKRNYRLWMDFINDYKNHGGRVTTGSDNGFIWQTYGFGYIRELEMLREAGFTPLEVIRSATLYGAQALGMEKDLGSIEVGKLADLVVIDQNPLENLQVLYGTGALRVTEDNKVVRVGGVKYTVKDGIVYDAKKMLEDVKAIVKEQKSR